MIVTFFALAALSPSLVSLHRDNQRQSKNANLKTDRKTSAIWGLCHKLSCLLLSLFLYLGQSLTARLHGEGDPQR